MYSHDKSNNYIQLKPGIAESFSRFHVLISSISQNNWIGKIQSIKGNQKILGDASQLETFLFKTDRKTITQARKILSKIQSGNFEIVRASAGSGKTFRLVLRYLECALRYDNPKYFGRILALTFTNKAAGEMKSRILSDLKKIVDGRSDKIKDLCSSLDLPESQLVSRAAVLHKEMLHRYSDIAVMTIDSFVNRLVRSFARDLAIEQDYRIEIDSNRVIEDAVSQLLDKVGTKGNESLTKLLEGFALQKVAEDEESGVRKPLNWGRAGIITNCTQLSCSRAGLPAGLLPFARRSLFVQRGSKIYED